MQFDGIIPFVIYPISFQVFERVLKYQDINWVSVGFWLIGAYFLFHQKFQEKRKFSSLNEDWFQKICPKFQFQNSIKGKGLQPHFHRHFPGNKIQMLNSFIILKNIWIINHISKIIIIFNYSSSGLFIWFHHIVCSSLPIQNNNNNKKSLSQIIIKKIPFFYYYLILLFIFNIFNTNRYYLNKKCNHTWVNIN